LASTKANFLNKIDLRKENEDNQNPQNIEFIEESVLEVKGNHGLVRLDVSKDLMKRCLDSMERE
jgi:hypothetical protein